MNINIHKLWNQYELIDCGKARKLERFGDIVLIRPEITAAGNPYLSDVEWKNIANAEFVETSKNSGNWIAFKSVPETWNLNYKSEKINLIAELSLTNTKHIGIFPEQIINWNFIEREHSNFGNDNFLNLFGYTGLSTIVAGHFFQKATHIDSIKKVVEWTHRNAKNSGISNIRFITEDAQKYVDREIKRNNKYDGIIMDPPAIGNGSNNEKWIFDSMIEKLLANVNKIVKDKSFIIMNLYSHSVYEKNIEALLKQSFPQHKIALCENVNGISKYGNSISHGYFIVIRKD